MKKGSWLLYVVMTCDGMFMYAMRKDPIRLTSISDFNVSSIGLFVVTKFAFVRVCYTIGTTHRHVFSRKGGLHTVKNGILLELFVTWCKDQMLIVENIEPESG